jgi:hypothetical protein
MTHTKHTPGPWHIGTNGDSIDAANLDKICDIPRYVTNPNRVADAALIAAAPDMLEALGRLRLEAIHYRNTGKGVEHLNAAIDNAEAIINKAS